MKLFLECRYFSIGYQNPFEKKIHGKNERSGEKTK